MMKFLKWSNVVFIVLALIGYIGWFYLSFHFPTSDYKILRVFIGMGFGFSLGSGIGAWLRSFVELTRIEAEEKEYQKFIQNPPPFRCPDCGMISHNKFDAINAYCGFCCAFKK